MNAKDKKKHTCSDKTCLGDKDFLHQIAEVKNEHRNYSCKICHKTNEPKHEASAKKIKNFKQ